MTCHEDTMVLPPFHFDQEKLNACKSPLGEPLTLVAKSRSQTYPKMLGDEKANKSNLNPQALLLTQGSILASSYHVKGALRGYRRLSNHNYFGRTIHSFP